MKAEDTILLMAIHLSQNPYKNCGTLLILHGCTAQRTVLLDSLSCSREVWQLERFLDMAITEGSGIRKQDGERVVTAVSRGVSSQYKPVTSLSHLPQDPGGSLRGLGLAEVQLVLRHELLGHHRQLGRVQVDRYTCLLL